MEHAELNVMQYSNNHVENSAWHPDKILREMSMSSVIILSIAHWVNGSWSPLCPLNYNNHLCESVLNSKSSYQFVVDYAQYLFSEMVYRYGRLPDYYCVYELIREFPLALLEGGNYSMPAVFDKIDSDLYEWENINMAYREYLRRNHKRTGGKLTWVQRSVPHWIDGE